VTGARREKYVATFSLVPFAFKIMKILLSSLFCCVILLQYRFMVCDGGIEEITVLQQRLDDLKEELKKKKNVMKRFMLK